MRSNSGKHLILLSVVTFALTASCARRASERRSYTLYRNSVVAEDARFHIATFDANEPESYNRANCEIAQQLFQLQSGVKTKFWCEKGFFRP